MRNMFKIALVFGLLAVVAVPFASAQELLNDRHRCTWEAALYDIGGGISIVDFASNTTIPDEELSLSEFEYDVALFLASGADPEVINALTPTELFESFGNLVDDLEFGLYDGLLFSTNDIGVFHSNNNTPFDWTDDYVTVSVVARTNKLPGINNSIACLFLLEYLDWADASPSDLLVYEQYEDGSTTPIDIWLNDGE